MISFLGSGSLFWSLSFVTYFSNSYFLPFFYCFMISQISSFLIYNKLHYDGISYVLFFPKDFIMLNFLFFFYFLFLFLNLFMAVLGLRFCVRAFSSCGKLGPLFITMRGPLIIAASLVAEHRLQTRRLSNCGSRA